MPGTVEAYHAFVVAAPGLELLALEEVRALGVRRARVIEGGGGIEFRASQAELYRVNLHSRVASRVLVRIAEFPATSFAELERRLKRVNWERWMAKGSPSRISVTCRKSKLYHSDAVAERVSGVLEKVLGGSTGVVATEGEEGPDPAKVPPQLLTIRLFRDVCTISLDSSGHLLHLRGYRGESGRAPLRETLAAGILIGSPWRHDRAIIDPMCGSGTIPIEAALMARRIAPGLRRAFAFSKWPDFDRQVWGGVRDAAKEAVLGKAAVPITGSDRDDGAIAASTENAKRAGVGGDIEFRKRSVSECEPTASQGLVLTNPPYGVRVGDREELRDLYARFGTVLRTRFHGWSVALLSADRRLEGQLRIRLEERLTLSNGGIPVRLMVGNI